MFIIVYIMLCYVTSYYIILYYILHYIISYNIILYYIVLHYIILYACIIFMCVQHCSTIKSSTTNRDYLSKLRGQQKIPEPPNPAGPPLRHHYYGNP